MHVKQTIAKVYISGCLFFLGVAFIFAFPLNWQIGLFVIGSLVVGLPHGALDYDVAKKMGYCKTLYQSAFFLLIYTAIAALNFVLWLMVPLAGFLFFILLSAWHFGEDWPAKSYGSIKRIVFGSAFLCLPSVMHSEMLITLFDYFLTKNESTIVVTALTLIAWPVITLCMMYLFIDLSQKRYAGAATAAAYVLSGLILPPVLFLFLYFCFLHGPMHTAELYKALRYQSMSQLLKRQTPVMLATLVLIGFIFLFFYQNVAVNEGIFVALIIGIACLTTPHMLLLERFRRHQYGA